MLSAFEVSTVDDLLDSIIAEEFLTWMKTVVPLWNEKLQTKEGLDALLEHPEAVNAIAGAGSGVLAVLSSSRRFNAIAKKHPEIFGHLNLNLFKMRNKHSHILRIVLEEYIGQNDICFTSDCK